MRLPRGPLQSRNFRLLLACNVISWTGSGVAVVAIPFAVLGIGGTASDVGYVAVATLVPVLVFVLLGGVLADRLPRHEIMLATNVAQALAQAAAAGLLLNGTAQVWELAVLAAVRGVAFGFYYPAAAGLLPQTVPAAQRAQANALDRIGRNTAQITGSALGGVLAGLAGPGWGLAADAASFAIAGALRAGMRLPARPPAPGPSMVGDLRDGWRDFIARRWLWVIVVQFTFTVAIDSPTQTVLGPVVAHAHLGGARSWGAILAAEAAGAVLGGLVMLRYRPHRMLVAAVLSVPALSLVLFALAIPLAVPLIAAAALAAGGCLEVFEVNWATAMQQEIPPAMLSRLTSYDALGSWALIPLGTAAAGPLAATFGTAAVLDAGGVLIVLFAAAVLCVPEVRHLHRQTHAGTANQDPVPG
jgi:MFS family permease